MEKIKSNKYKENDKKELLAHANLLILQNVNCEPAIIRVPIPYLIQLFA